MTKLLSLVMQVEKKVNAFIFSDTLANRVSSFKTKFPHVGESVDF